MMTRIRVGHPGARLSKLCSLGETTGGLRQRVAEGFSLKPTIVTLSVGINDIMLRISEEEFAANYEAILKSLEPLAAPIVVTNLPDISFAPRLPNSMREEMHVRILLFNKRIEALAKRYRLFFVDLYAATAKLLNNPNFFASDGFHPSDAGYKLWTRTMWPTVRSVIKGSVITLPSRELGDALTEVM
jgi:lysophospholipase L1-like esterase